MIPKGILVSILIACLLGACGVEDDENPEVDWSVYLTRVAAINVRQEQRAQNLRGLLSSSDPPLGEELAFTRQLSANAAAYVEELSVVIVRGEAETKHLELLASLSRLQTAYSAQLSMLKRSDSAPVDIDEIGRIYAEIGDAHFAVKDDCRDLQATSDGLELGLDMRCPDLIIPPDTVQGS